MTRRVAKSLGSVIVATAFLFTACAAKSPPSNTTAAAPTSGTEEPVAKLSQPLVIEDVGFMTPESVLYDAAADVYLVSNVQGSALDVDDNGFISRVKPDGSIAALKWIDGGNADVKLDAPKGMAIVDGVLYIADISYVRKFDSLTGKPRGSLKVEGATFLNDIAADATGTLYVTDSGLTTGFAASGGDAIYRVTHDGAVVPLVKDAQLGHPNGLLASTSGLWVVSFGSGELYKVDAAGQRSDVQKSPKGSLDGIVQFGDRLFVSSWEAAAIFERRGSELVEVISGVSAPADIGFDSKRQRVLIPLFNDDAVVIHQL